jgi:hypothetical protein
VLQMEATIDKYEESVKKEDGLSATNK